MRRRLQYVSRRRLLLSAGAAAGGLAAGAGGVMAFNARKKKILDGGEWLSYRVHRALFADTLAPEFTEADISPRFWVNGNRDSDDETYQAHAAEDFVNWKLEVGGLVERPGKFSLDELRAMPAREQITRHDCVEGWSAIAKWKGVRLSALLDEVGLKPQARYIVFFAADKMFATNYYESIDLVDARHEQTILAYDMNEVPLPRGHGAPIRLRVERQLGYKHCKFVMRVEAVESLSGIVLGNGGLWEDASGYAWYAGI